MRLASPEHRSSAARGSRSTGNRGSTCRSSARSHAARTPRRASRPPFEPVLPLSHNDRSRPGVRCRWRTTPSQFGRFGVSRLVPLGKLPCQACVQVEPIDVVGATVKLELEPPRTAVGFLALLAHHARTISRNHAGSFPTKEKRSDRPRHCLAIAPPHRARDAHWRYPMQLSKTETAI